MEFSFRFYTNKHCAHLPCHNVENIDEFNCMFCYCPLYLLEDCGGNFKMSSGIKDCSDCLIPHRPNGYDYINNKLAEINQKKAMDYLEAKDREEEENNK